MCATSDLLLSGGRSKTTDGSKAGSPLLPENLTPGKLATMSARGRPHMSNNELHVRSHVDPTTCVGTLPPALPAMVAGKFTGALTPTNLTSECQHWCESRRLASVVALQLQCAQLSSRHQSKFTVSFCSSPPGAPLSGFGPQLASSHGV